MATLRWNDERFEIADNPKVKDAIWLEAQAGKPLSKMGEGEQLAATLLLTLRRNNVMLTWSDVLELDIEDLDMKDDEAEADPTLAGVTAG